MRTVSFKSVYDAILQKLGLDPVGDAVTSDTARAITEHLTERVQTAWQMWDWSVLTRTEERGFRSPWHQAVLYKPLNEVYYVLNKKYYRVKGTANPPVGTVPTNTIYWDEITPTTFVDRDQVSLPPLGQVVGVYKSDPSLNGSSPHDICLKFRPNDSGVYVCYAPLPSVFICHVIPPPTYTMIPWVSGKPYVSGNRVFWFVLGEVYRCISATAAQPPSDPLYWIKEPVPDVFASYLKSGAAADCLKETAPAEDQIRLARAGLWDSEATAAIQGEIDQLLAQGQKHYYTKPYWDNGWCLGEPWLGSTVIPLTPDFLNTAPDDAPPVVPPDATMIYRPEIVSVWNVEPSLVSFPTVGYPLDTLIKITVGTIEEGWRLDPGPSNPSDPNQYSPNDYNSVTNDKHFTKVS